MSNKLAKFHAPKTWLPVVMGALLLCYGAVALSPLPTWIGRTNPSIASLLSPPMLNFYANYDSGQVLGLEIGMTREEFRDRLRISFSEDLLAGNCAEGAGLPNQIPIKGESFIVGEVVEVRVENAEVSRNIALSSDTVCIDAKDRPQLVIVYFASGRVTLIDVSYTRISI